MNVRGSGKLPLEAVVTPLDPRATPGTVVNSGLITAARGNIGVFGTTITQDGVLEATTAVNANGSITLEAEAQPYLDVTQTSSGPKNNPFFTVTATFQTIPAGITIASDSVIAILPDSEPQADGTQRTLSARLRFHVHPVGDRHPRRQWRAAIGRCCGLYARCRQRAGIFHRQYRARHQSAEPGVDRFP